MNRGSVWNLQGGKIEEAMFDLTGAPARKMEIWKKGLDGEKREVISSEAMKQAAVDKEIEKRKAEEARKQAEEDIGFFDKIVNFFKNIGKGDDESKQSSSHHSRVDFVRNGEKFEIIFLENGIYLPLDEDELDALYAMIEENVGQARPMVAKTKSKGNFERKTLSCGLKENMGYELRLTGLGSPSSMLRH